MIVGNIKPAYEFNMSKLAGDVGTGPRDPSAATVFARNRAQYTSTHLCGGNVQHTMLAREVSGTVHMLIVQNPCAGLDLAAPAEMEKVRTACTNKADCCTVK